MFFKGAPRKPIPKNNLFETDTPALKNPPEELKRYFYHIRYNEEIPKKINEMDAVVIARRLGLLNAIQKADFNDDVFQDPDCEFYTYYLIGTHQITFDQGIEVIKYLSALMNFTTKQSINERDEKKFSLKDKIREAQKNPEFGELKVEKLMEGDELTQFGKKYLSLLQEKMSYCNKKFKFLAFNEPISEKEFIDLLRSMNSEIEKCVLVLPHFWLIDMLDDAQKFMSAVYANNNLITLDNDLHFLVPSFSLLNAMYKKYYDHPPKMVPILGHIKEQTLHAYHQRDEHPVNFYSPYVSDQYRITSVHNWDFSGPAIIAFHDVLGHLAWISMIKKEDRDLIDNQLIPLLTEIKQSMNSNDQSNQFVQDMVTGLQNELTDYSLVTLLKNAPYPYMLNKCGFESNTMDTTLFYILGTFGCSVYAEDWKEPQIMFNADDATLDVYLLLIGHFTNYVASVKQANDPFATLLSNVITGMSNSFLDRHCFKKDVDPSLLKEDCSRLIKILMDNGYQKKEIETIERIDTTVLDQMVSDRELAADQGLTPM
jgi:hypothetical protein